VVLFGVVCLGQQCQAKVSEARKNTDRETDSLDNCNWTTDLYLDQWSLI